MAPSTPRARRRSDEVEQTLVERILDGTYAPGARLPLERVLAEELGVGRPTLREAIQRLERDGWLTVRKAVGTTVNDYWREGTLNILAPMVRHGGAAPPDLPGWLTELRIGVAPLYVRQAVRESAARVVAVLVDHEQLPDEPEAFVAFDLRWQTELARLASNPLYNLYNQSFRGVFEAWAPAYFSVPDFRERSRAFYAALLRAAMAGDAAAAERVTREAMQEALENWRRANNRSEP